MFIYNLKLPLIYAYTFQLLLDNGLDVDSKNNDGRTALFLSVLGKHGVVAEKLVQRGANVRLVDKYGWSPLHVTAARGQLKLSKILIGHGGSLWHAIAFWRTASHWLTGFVRKCFKTVYRFRIFRHRK